MEETISILRLVFVFAFYVVASSALSISGKAGGAGLNSRRDFLSAAGASGLIIPRFSPTAAAVSSDGVAYRPVAVVGASGRTGALCVASCLKRGIPVRALTRSGEWHPPASDAEDASSSLYTINDKLLSIQQCDAHDPTALETGVEGCRGVIFAASASKKGGKANEIDNEAAVAAGRACIAKGVPRYIVISSTAVTRPKSLGYKFTNVYQNIMGEKRSGELGVMNSYKESTTSSYTIIRPGGLEEPKRNTVLGPSALELSQGDALAGIISRADLAEVAVEAALAQSRNLQDTSFELYYTDGAQPCEGRFKSLLQSGEVSRLHGDTYEALFRGLNRDGEYFVPA